MNITFENKNKDLMENCYMCKNNVEVCGWYGLTYFEIVISDGDIISLSNREDLYDLRDCINKMIKEIERLERRG